MEKEDAYGKNNLVINMQGQILYLSQTYPESVHDHTICKEEELVFEKELTVLTDFLGLGLHFAYREDYHA